MNRKMAWMVRIAVAALLLTLAGLAFSKPAPECVNVSFTLASQFTLNEPVTVDVLIENDCQANPRSGYALIKNTSAGGNSLPELGTAILDFHNQCDGMADVSLATGVYIKSNGKSIPLYLN